MNRFFVVFACLFCSLSVSAQQEFIPDTLNLTFLGDIMGHQAQMRAAIDSTGSGYNYNSVFKYIAPELLSDDFTIGNLELTLAGSPYSGYPRFSSPDAIAKACLENGIDVLCTANNHACDKGAKGIRRTIRVLDSLGIAHTGTFSDSLHRKNSHLLILEKGNIRLGILNYTNYTNGLKPGSALVNKMDTTQMKRDIADSQLGGT